MKNILFLMLIGSQLYSAASSSPVVDANEVLGWFLLEQAIKAGYETNSYQEAVKALVAAQRSNPFKEEAFSKDHPLIRVSNAIWDFGEPDVRNRFRKTMKESLADADSDLRRVLDQNEGGAAATGLRDVLKNILAKESNTEQQQTIVATAAPVQKRPIAPITDASISTYLLKRFEEPAHYDAFLKLPAHKETIDRVFNKHEEQPSAETREFLNRLRNAAQKYEGQEISNQTLQENLQLLSGAQE